MAVALLVVLAGCASLGGGADGGDAGVDMSADEAPTGAQAQASGGAQSGSGDGGGGAAVSAAAVDRAIVRTGSVELTVENFEATRNAIAAEAKRYGGYVGGSSQTLHRAENVSWTTGQVVVRVPSDRFSDLVGFAEEQGTVESVQTETEDVTDRLVELDARISNLEAKRSRLRSFYNRADSTSELLSIEERLSSVQGEIEQLKATEQSLEDRVAFSTLRISIAEERPEPARDAPEDDGTTVASAFFASVQQMVDGGYALLLVLAALAPFAVVLGVPGAVGYGLYRRRRAAGPADVASEPDDIETEPAGDPPDGE